MSPTPPDMRLVHAAALAQPLRRHLTRAELALAAQVMRQRRHRVRSVAATLAVRERDVPALLAEAEQEEVTAA